MSQIIRGSHISVNFDIGDTFGSHLSSDITMQIPSLSTVWYLSHGNLIFQEECLFVFSPLVPDDRLISGSKLKARLQLSF
jgi:hypothetical protein